ncbi:MAG: hypothetical protein E7530_01385 [Ruminococcaceae bacterium]|nr:hypothetical protein [Oscillospiraceae bacterium]
MTEKILSFWEYVKLRSLSVLSGTRGEYRPGKTEDSDANEYFINGVRYIVTKKFSAKENKTMKEKISAFIGSDFAHLTNADDINTLNTEYVNSTAGEGRINAVR